MILSGQNQLNTIHYSLDPTLGFHRAALYSSSASVDQFAGSRVSVQAIYTLCFSQFGRWIESFRTLARLQRVVVRLHCGDAFILSDLILQKSSSAVSSAHTSPDIDDWAVSIVPVNIQSDLPGDFHVINTMVNLSQLGSNTPVGPAVFFSLLSACRKCSPAFPPVYRITAER